MKSSQSAEDLNSGGDGDYHCGGGEISPCVHVHSDGEHMMSSDKESKDPYCYHCVDHTKVAERFLLT